MNMYTGQRRFPAATIAVVLFILCVMLVQFWLAKQLPLIAGIAQINPSLVFLDIPVQLPLPIDLILTPALFFLVYPFVILFYPSHPGMPFWWQAFHRIKSAFVGLFLLLCFVLAGGLIYYFIQDHLSTRVLNAINTLGINADIHLTYPAQQTIYLRGSMILFVCFVIGLVICIRKIRKQPAERLTREQRITPYERMLEERRKKPKEGLVSEAYKPAYLEKAPIQTSHQLCCNHPVLSLRPLAVKYMPM